MRKTDSVNVYEYKTGGLRTGSDTAGAAVPVLSIGL